MSSNEIYHHGILGMRWGVRRYQKKDGTLTPAGKKRSGEDDKNDTPQPKKKTVKDMSDSDLKDRIARLELEKRYKDLSKNEERVEVSKGKAFIKDVLEKSGKNIATQAVTYAMGTAVNKLFDSDIVNPKKGQKDK